MSLRLGPEGELQQIQDYLASAELTQQTQQTLHKELEQIDLDQERESFLTIKMLERINAYWPKRIIYTFGGEKHPVAMSSISVISDTNDKTQIRYVALTPQGPGRIVFEVDKPVRVSNKCVVYNPLGDDKELKVGSWNSNMDTLRVLDTYFRFYDTSDRKLDDRARAYIIYGSQPVIELHVNGYPLAKIPIQIVNPEDIEQSNQFANDMQDTLSILIGKQEETVAHLNNQVDTHRARLEMVRQVGYTLVSTGLVEPQEEPGSKQTLRNKFKGFREKIKRK